MTEFVVGLGAALSKAGAAAATAVSSSSALTILQGGLTLAGALGSIAAGGAQAEALRGEAGAERLAANDAMIRGQEEAARLKRDLLDTVSRQSVAYAAGGVELSSGSVQTARRRASEDAERELGFARNDALRASLSHRHNARMLDRRARSARYASLSRGLGQIGGFAMQAAQRG